MSNKISVIIDVTVDRANRALKGFQASVKEADGAVGKFKAGTKSASDSLKANIMPVAAAAGAAVVGFAVKAVGAASDLEQAVGAVEKSFGDASGEVLAFAENAAESVGLSERAYAEAAVRLGSFAKQIAQDTGKPVAEVLNDLIVRSSDLAATFGVDVSEAIAKVSSGLAGESEPLRAWGIDMRKTAVQAHAASVGMEDMSEATQAAGLLFESSSDYANQFADESETLAGQQQRLGAEYENLQAELGTGLLPIMTDAVKIVRGLGDAYEYLSDNQAVAIDQIPIIGRELDTALGPMLDPIGAAAGLFGDLSEALSDSGDAAQRTDEQMAALVQSHTVNKERTEAYQGAVEGATAAVEDEEKAAEELEQQLKDNVEALKDITKAQDDARDSVSAYHDAVVESIDSSLAYRNQTVRTADAIAAANEEIGDGENALAEYEQAQRDAEGAALDQAAAAVAQADAQAQSNGQMLTAQQKTDRYIEELESLVGELNGPAAFAVQMHIDRLNAIPRSIDTALTFSGRGSAPNRAGQDYRKVHGGGLVTGGIKPFDGLRPDEVPAVLQKGEAVLTPEQQGAALGAGGRGGNVYLTVNAGLGANGTDIGRQIVEELQKYQRRNGPGSLP